MSLVSVAYNLMCSLVIHTLVDELKEAEMAVECSGRWISALLYGDNMVMFAKEEEDLVRG